MNKRKEGARSGEARERMKPAKNEETRIERNQTKLKTNRRRSDSTIISHCRVSVCTVLQANRTGSKNTRSRSRPTQ